MIDQGVNLIRFSALFGTKLEAYSFFAKTMQDRHCLEKLQSVDNCVCCGTRSGNPTELEWRTTIYKVKTAPIDLLLLSAGHITYRQIEVPMKTYHSICDRCTRRVKIRHAMLYLLNAVLFFCFIASLLAAVSLTVFAIGLLFYMPDTFLFFGPGAVVAIFILWLVVCGTVQAQDWAVPASLREIGRTSFKLVSANTVTSGVANCRPGGSHLRISAVKKF